MENILQYAKFLVINIINKVFGYNLSILVTLILVTPVILVTLFTRFMREKKFNTMIYFSCASSGGWKITSPVSQLLPFPPLPQGSGHIFSQLLITPDWAVRANYQSVSSRVTHTGFRPLIIQSPPGKRLHIRCKTAVLNHPRVGANSTSSYKFIHVSAYWTFTIYDVHTNTVESLLDH